MKIKLLTLPAEGRSILLWTFYRRQHMSLDEHIGSLRVKHAELETLIADQNRRPHPDLTQVAELKRQKLRIKEEIEGISRH